MAHINADLVRETTATTGTGTYNLAGAQTNFRSFLAAPMATGDTCWYCARLGADFEIGVGTFTDATPDTLARTMIIASSNANNAVNWGAGDKDIYICSPGSIIGNDNGAGRLTFISATQIKFSPKNGNRIKIAGVIYQIPFAGITAANTSVFVNGVGGQNLAASTAYLVTLFNNSGTLTIDFISTLTHTVDAAAGNIGVEIKNGDNTRSVIGLAYTNGSSQFFYLGVLSWFNRRRKSANGVLTTTRTSTSTSSTNELHSEIRVPFATWSDEAVHALFGGAAFPSATVNHQVISGIGFDGGAREIPYSIYQAPTTTQSYINPFIKIMKEGLSEGGHYATVYATVGGAGQTATYDGGTLTVEVMG